MKSRSNLKKMVRNNNNRLSSSSSSPILKRHKKMMTMDDDLIGKVRTTTISDLPEELITKVLVRLSVKDIILACVCVQKSWFCLIRSRMFITLHSNYHHHKISSSSNPNKYLLFLDRYTRAYEIRLDDIQCEKYLTLKYPPHLSNQCFEHRLVSDGLICLFELNQPKTRQHIYLWNPVIQKYITLPRPPHPSRWRWRKAVAFGFVPQVNDYVVVVMAKYGGLENKPRTHYITTCVYSLSTNSWRKITHHNTHIRNICQSESIIVNGIAIWIGYNSHMDRILVCFDTKTDMLRHILSPKSLERDPIIHAFNESIVYSIEKGMDFNEHDMWILKGDPMDEFVWEKKMMIRVESFVRFLGLRNNGEPILRNSFDLISYNLDNGKSYDFVKSWKSWTNYRFGNDPQAAFYFWTETVDHPPFIIKPFAESLGLLDIDSMK